MRLILVLTAFAGLLAACTPLTQLQDSVTKFDQGTHTAATAQEMFLRNVQAADCEAAFYNGTLEWARDTAQPYTVNVQCPNTLLPESQYKVRQELMDAISLYADKMAALATDDDDKSLSSDAQKLAGTLNTEATTHQFNLGGAGSAVEAAIIGIADFAIDRVRVSNLQDAAAKMQPQLSQVVEALKAENLRYAIAVASKIGQVELDLAIALHGAHGPAGQVDSAAFFRAATAREIQKRINPFAGPADQDVDQMKNDPDLAAPQNMAVELNKTLDAIVKSNAAIAEKKKDTGAIIAAVNDLIARAQAAQAMQAALSK
jgi:hypothetical protein